MQRSFLKTDNQNYCIEYLSMHIYIYLLLLISIPILSFTSIQAPILQPYNFFSLSVLFGFLKF